MTLYSINCDLEYSSRVYIEADSEAEAREKFDNLDWDDESNDECINWTIKNIGIEVDND